MAANIGNPAGTVMISDGGAPRLISGYAREIISGGCFVFGSTAANVVSSGTNSFAASDIKFCTNATGNAVNGMALNTAASGAIIAVVRAGDVICLADGTVTAGFPVVVTGVNAVRDAPATGSQSAAILGSGTVFPIGRAVTGAGSEGYCIVHLNL